MNDAVVTLVDVYDPATNTWDSSPYDWTGASSDLGAFTEGNAVYLAGGWSAAYSPLATLIKFVPSTSTVTDVGTDMPGGARGDVGVISVPITSADLAQGHYH